MKNILYKSALGFSLMASIVNAWALNPGSYKYENEKGEYYALVRSVVGNSHAFQVAVFNKNFLNVYLAEEKSPGSFALKPYGILTAQEADRGIQVDPHAFYVSGKDISIENQIYEREATTSGCRDYLTSSYFEGKITDKKSGFDIEVRGDLFTHGESSLVLSFKMDDTYEWSEWTSGHYSYKDDENDNGVRKLNISKFDRERQKGFVDSSSSKDQIFTEYSRIAQGLYLVRTEEDKVCTNMAYMPLIFVKKKGGLLGPDSFWVIATQFQGHSFRWEE